MDLTSSFPDDECLMISGIQHFAFCPRQWQLIHLDMEWEDNELTAMGQLLHKRTNTPDLPQLRGDTVTLRSVPLISHRLGVYGLSDVVELTPTTGEKYLRHPRYPGRWQAAPVEYKKGRPKRHNADKLQLCAEAVCLEEMYDIMIDVGYLYYGETKRRLEVTLDRDLRKELEETLITMHRLMESCAIAHPAYDSRCRRCSVREICLPELSEKGSVSEYYHRHKIALP